MSPVWSDIPRWRGFGFGIFFDWNAVWWGEKGVFGAWGGGISDFGGGGVICGADCLWTRFLYFLENYNADTLGYWRHRGL